MQSNNKISKNLADQSYWDEAYSSYSLEDKVGDDDIIKKWLLQYIPKTKTQTCLEIGCFPGRYLTVMGDLGYTLSGVDLTPRVKDEFPIWLKNNGYQIGTFQQENFFNYNPNQTFDLVCSFGFIEHFTNWESVLMKHIELVNDTGYLVIETPNFRGWLQRFIHKFLDNENYKRHYIPSMNPEMWATICEKHGFEIIYKGYIGEFQFWVDKEPTTYFRRKTFELILKNYDKLRKLKPGKSAYSPFCGIIAKRKNKN